MDDAVTPQVVDIVVDIKLCDTLYEFQGNIVNRDFLKGNIRVNNTAVYLHKAEENAKVEVVLAYRLI